MTEALDAIVVGGGTMGLSAALALAKRGASCLVLEQFGVVHGLGSHGGRTRIIRQAYAESPDYVPLVQRAESEWLQLEQAVGVPILHRTGGLDLQAPGYHWASKARCAARQHGIPHEWLDGADVRKRWNAWSIGDEWQACYSPSTGFLDVEAALRAIACVANRHGVAIHEGEPVREWTAENASVVVTTDRKRYLAKHLVLTAGAWTETMFRSLNLPITVLRKVVWWLDVDNSTKFAIGRFPIFISESSFGSIYGLPTSGIPGIKTANHAGGEVTTADSVDRAVHEDEASDVLAFARAALQSVTPRVLGNAVCLYSMTPDRDFIVDRHPEHANVVVAAGFSGHGFKFAPEIGELLADLALDGRAKPMQRFALSRFER